MLDLTKLQYFVVVAKYQNLTEASKELHISQPALSKAIVNLEDELGINLFYRQGKRLYLNKNGEFFKQRADKLLAEVEDLQKELVEVDGEAQQFLSIISTLPYSIIELFNEFLDEYPTTKLRQVSLSIENLNDFVERGMHDLCITTEEIEHPNLEWIPLVEERIYLSVPREHPFAERNYLEIADIAKGNLEFVGLLPSFAFRRLTDNFFLDYDIKLNYKIEVEESTAVLHLVRTGKGVSFTPQYAIDLYPSEIRHIPIRNNNFTRTIGILKHKHYYQTQRAKAFIESAMDYFQEF